jgi:hypothetical protein
MICRREVNMSNVLEMTKLPYLLTALLAAFSWNAVHLTNRYIDSPIIEWSYRVEKRGGEKVGIYDIYNLSRGKRFEDITFSLHLRSGYFTQCVVEKIVPAGNVAVSYPKAEAFQTQKIEKLEVTVTELHPKWKIRIIVGNSGNERCRSYSSYRSNQRSKGYCRGHESDAEKRSYIHSN